MARDWALRFAELTQINSTTSSAEDEPTLFSGAMDFASLQTRCLPSPFLDRRSVDTDVLALNGEKVDPKRQYVLPRGGTVSMGTPGGGDYGDLATRDLATGDPTSIDRDLEAGYVSTTGGTRGAVRRSPEY